MLKESLSPKHILVDLISIQCQLKDLFKNDEQYRSIIEFLGAKDYYNDPDIPYPTMKEVEKGTGLSPTQLRKKLLEMYAHIFDYESQDMLKFEKTEYSFYLTNFDLHGQFEVGFLKHVPRAGEELSLPFVNEKMGTKNFYVDKVVHYFENDLQRVVIYLKGGFYNSYWETRKHEALLKEEITIEDIYKLYDFQLKEKLGFPW